MLLGMTMEGHGERHGQSEAARTRHRDPCPAWCAALLGVVAALLLVQPAGSALPFPHVFSSCTHPGQHRPFRVPGGPGTRKWVVVLRVGKGQTLRLLALAQSIWVCQFGETGLFSAPTLCTTHPAFMQSLLTNLYHTPSFDAISSNLEEISRLRLFSDDLI